MYIWYNKKMKSVEDWKKIDWVASYPKSGNTWVRCFLEAYFTGSLDVNDMRCCGADDHVFWSAPEGSNFIVEAPSEIRLLERTWGLMRSVEGYVCKDRYSPMYVKTHSAFLNVDGQAMLPPLLTKSITYIVRDPRTVAPSYAAHFGVSLDEAIKFMSLPNRMLVKENNARMPSYISSWDINVDSYLTCKDKCNILFIKYEDLLTDPEKWFSELIKHSGVKVDNSRVCNAVELTKLSKLREKEKEEGFEEKSDAQKSLFFGGERAKLSSSQHVIIEKNFEKQMVALNYL